MQAFAASHVAGRNLAATEEFPRALWQALGAAGLFRIGLAQDCGGDGAHALKVMNALIARDVFVRKSMAPVLDRAIRVSCGPEEEIAVFAEEFPDALAEARRLGIDVVVVDHHELGLELPPAVAVVNPNRQDNLSHLGHLAAAGVTFLVVVAVNRLLRARGWYGASRPEPEQSLLLVGGELDHVRLHLRKELLEPLGPVLHLLLRGEVIPDPIVHPTLLG